MQEHIESDFRVYNEVYKELLEEECLGMTALMHDGSLEAIYDHLGDAYHTGVNNFGEGKFTLITIGEKPAELGALGIGLI